MTAQREIGKFTLDPVSVGDLFARALIPGFGLALPYMTYQFIIGILRPQDCLPIPAGGEEAIGVELVATLVPPITLIVAVLGTIMAGIATPTKAAGVFALLTVLVTSRELDGILQGTMRVSTLAVVIFIGATFLSLVFRSFSGDEIVTHLMEKIPGGGAGGCSYSIQERLVLTSDKRACRGVVIADTSFSRFSSQTLDELSTELRSDGNQIRLVREPGAHEGLKGQLEARAAHDTFERLGEI